MPQHLPGGHFSQLRSVIFVQGIDASDEFFPVSWVKYGFHGRFLFKDSI
jgi:hypothetical protein